eukprot:PITA_23287
MQHSKPMKVPIPIGAKLFAKQCPKTQEEEEDMSRVPYASEIGSLMYAMVCTRPNITDVVGVLSMFMSKPRKNNWTSVKRVFRRSTGGYVFNLFGGVVSWMSKRQSVVALSTTEVEYMVVTHAGKEEVWLQILCSSMGLVQRAIRIYCDNHSEISLENKPTYHSKTKHIDVQYHFVRDIGEDKKLLLVKVDTLNNIADALKKCVSTEKFSWCRETMGVVGLDQ